MIRAKLSDIETVVRDVVARSAIAKSVGQVRLEEDRDENGIDFLRIVMPVKAAEKMNWTILAPLTRAIEDEVGQIDERFPSIRLAEAA